MNIIKVNICLPSFIFFALLCEVRADLTWEKKQLDFTPKAEESVIVARFPFANTGDKPVTLTSIKTSCGCTTAEVEKDTYKPNEKGEIIAKFTIGQRVGLQEKTIVIHTDESPNSTIVLTIKATIPEILKISPEKLSWKKGEPNTPKTIKILVVNEAPIQVLRVKSTNEVLFPELKTIKSGKEYEIKVTPSSTSQVNQAGLFIETDFPKGKPKTFSANAFVGNEP